MRRFLKLFIICVSILSSFSAFAETEGASLSASPSTLFLRARVGSMDSGFSRIYNSGNEDVNYVYVSDSCFMNFYVNHSCFGILRPGASCSLNVSYRPTSPGFHTCSISIQASGTFGTSVWVNGQAEAVPQEQE